MLNSFSSTSSSLLTKEVVFSFFAAIGGLILLIGLWLEFREGLKSEKEWYLDIDDFRKCKKKSKQGEIWVMVGVSIEVVIAIFFAVLDVKDKYEINVNADKNNPLNKPLSSVSARANIEVLMSQEAQSNAMVKVRPIKEWQILFANLELRTLNTNIVVKNIPISAAPGEIVPYIGGFLSVSSSPNNSVVKSRKSEFGYNINFSEDETMFYRESFNKDYAPSQWPTVGQVLTNFNVVEITQNFMPVGVEVIGGNVDIIMNGIETNFDIVPQPLKAGNNDGWSFIIQTN